MSVDCTSNVIWGGVVSDSSDEDDVINSHHDVIYSPDDLTPQSDYAYSPYACEGQFPYMVGCRDMGTITPTYTFLNGSVDPSNEQTTLWNGPEIQFEEKVNSSQQQQQRTSRLGSSNFFSQFDSEFKVVPSSQLDDLSDPLDSTFIVGHAGKSVIANDGENQLHKIEYKCEAERNCDIMIPTDDNEATESVVTLDSAQQLISAIDNSRQSVAAFESSSSVKKKTRKTDDASSSKPLKASHTSLQSFAENKRSELENLILNDRKCHKCDLIFKNLGAKIEHDVTYHLVPMFESDRKQTSALAAEATEKKIEEKVSCPTCNYSEVKKNNVVSNFLSHKTVIHVGRYYQKQPNTVRCLFCRLSLKSEKQHFEEDGRYIFWMTVHFAKKEQLLCFLCGVISAKKSAMKRHLLVHKDTSEKSHVCKVCDEMFSFEKIKDHVISQECITDKVTIGGVDNKCLTSCKLLSAVNLPIKSMLDIYGSSVCEIVDFHDRPNVQELIKSSSVMPLDEAEHCSQQVEKPDEVLPCLERCTFSDESKNWTQYLHSAEYLRKARKYHLTRTKKKCTVTNSTDDDCNNETGKDASQGPKKKKKKKDGDLDFCQVLPINIVVSSVRSLAQAAVDETSTLSAVP